MATGHAPQPPPPETLGAIATAALAILAGAAKWLQGRKDDQDEEERRTFDSAISLMDRLQEDNRQLRDELDRLRDRIDQQDRTINALRSLLKRHGIEYVEVAT